MAASLASEWNGSDVCITLELSRVLTERPDFGLLIVAVPKHTKERLATDGDEMPLHEQP